MDNSASAIPDASKHAALWQEFGKDSDSAVRERVVDAYLPFARILAGKRYAGRTYSELEFADYLQYALIGLLEAIDRFDPARGIKFETFAAPRIDGAILSGIQTLSEKQEQVKARQRIVADRVQSVKADPPNQDDPDAVFGYLAELAIGLAVGLALEDSGMYQEEHQSYPDNSYHSIELKQLRTQIRALVDSLPHAERRVIMYHYLQQFAFEEIAKIMAVTRGRVSQLHRAALNRLKNHCCHGDSIDLRY